MHAKKGSCLIDEKCCSRLCWASFCCNLQPWCEGMRVAGQEVDRGPHHAQALQPSTRCGPIVLDDAGEQVGDFVQWNSSLPEQGTWCVDRVSCAVNFASRLPHLVWL